MSKELPGSDKDKERWEGIANGSIVPTQEDWDSLNKPKGKTATQPDKKSDDQG